MEFWHIIILGTMIGGYFSLPCAVVFVGLVIADTSTDWLKEYKKSNNK